MKPLKKVSHREINVYIIIMKKGLLLGQCVQESIHTIQSVPYVWEEYDGKNHLKWQPIKFLHLHQNIGKSMCYAKLMGYFFKSDLHTISSFF